MGRQKIIFSASSKRTRDGRAQWPSAASWTGGKPRGWTIGPWAATSAVALAASLSFGQVAPVPGGHALDANPGVGSGGSNQPVPGYVPINGNEVMTGNVAGLGYFHGNLPYRSPYEFQAPLGSSTLNNFERQSAGNTNTYTGSNQAAQSYYLPSRLVSSMGGQINAAAAQAGGSGFSASLTGPYAISPNSAFRGSMGSALKVLPAGSELPVRDYSRLSNEYVSPTNEGSTQANSLFGLRVSMQPESGVGMSTDTSLSGRNNGQLINPTLPPLEGSQTPATQPSPNDNSVGRPIRTGPGELPRNDQVTAMAGSKPLNAMAGQTNPGETAGNASSLGLYGTLVTQLNGARKPGLGDRASSGLPGTTTAPGRAVTGGATGRPDIDPLTGELRSPLETKYQSINPAAANYRPKEFMREQAAPMATDKLQAARDIKPLATLTTPTLHTPYETLMAMAERQLQDGQYFAAAELYQRAISASDDNPLPLVGRIHAELAGGLYQSAAYDLQYLFDRKPELTALHYDLSTFLTAHRIEFLRKDIETLVSKKETNSGYFLLAYLQYQTGDMEHLRDTLAAWAVHDRKDRWPAVLGKAWLEAKDQPHPRE